MTKAKNANTEQKSLTKDQKLAVFIQQQGNGKTKTDLQQFCPTNAAFCLQQHWDDC